MKYEVRSKIEDILGSENVFLVLDDRVELLGHFLSVQNLFKMFEGEQRKEKKVQVPKDYIVR